MVAQAWSSQLQPDAIDRGLAQLTQEALLSALSRFPGHTDTPQPRSAGAAVRIRCGTSAPAPTGIAADADVRIHLGSIGIAPNAEPDPSVTEVRIGLSRPGGWLVGGPSQDHPSGLPREPRARTAELRLRTSLDVQNTRASITIREGSALGVTRRTWTVDETVIGRPAATPSVSDRKPVCCFAKSCRPRDMSPTVPPRAGWHVACCHRSRRSARSVRITVRTEPLERVPRRSTAPRSPHPR